jgi:hypothetical protein
MKFENEQGEPVEIDFENFDKVLPGEKLGLTQVKFKNGTAQWIKATKDEIVQATAIAEE